MTVSRTLATSDLPVTNGSVYEHGGSLGRYRLEPLTPDEAARWDELIKGYESTQLFHRKAWLDYLAASRGVTIRQWAIRSGSETVGYLCGGLLKRGPFRILGSPLRGWGTNFMGPVMDRDLDQEMFLRAVDALALEEGLAMIEIEHPLLDESALERAGFEAIADFAYVVSLAPREPDRMWDSLRSTCRNRIRRAINAGLSVEDTPEPAVADEYHEQYALLPRRKGIVPPIPKEYARLLVSSLKPIDALFALRARDRSGQVVATGLFPHDEQTMYYWSGSSQEDALPLCPNELIQWTAMRLAAERGLRVYNMCGYGRFKEKFGGRLTVVKRWHKCYTRTARWARRGYELSLHARVRLRSPWLRLQSFVGNGTARVGTLGTKSEAPAPVRRGIWRTHVFWPRPRRPALRLSDLWKAPLHDFAMRDEALYQYLPLASDMEVLEIGPGSGITAFRLARHIRHLALLDVAPANIAQLREAFGVIPNVSFICADICKPGLTDLVGRRFDAVYGLEVFEYLPNPGVCLENIAALLRVGGRLLLLFPNYPPPRSPGIACFPTRSELDRLLSEAGFANWRVYALQLRPYARMLYEHLHEQPLRVYRRMRSHGVASRPLTYDGTWAFRQRPRVELFKVPLHAAWAALALAMRLGGNCFERTLLKDDIMNRNLLLVAER